MGKNCVPENGALLPWRHKKQTLMSKLKLIFANWIDFEFWCMLRRWFDLSTTAWFEPWTETQNKTLLCPTTSVRNGTRINIKAVARNAQNWTCNFQLMLMLDLELLIFHDIYAKFTGSERTCWMFEYFMFNFSMSPSPLEWHMSNLWLDKHCASARCNIIFKKNNRPIHANHVKMLDY